MIFQKAFSLMCLVLALPTIGSASECREQNGYRLVALSRPLTNFSVNGHAIMIVNGLYKTEGAWGGPVAAVFAQDQARDWEIVANESNGKKQTSQGQGRSLENRFLSFGVPHTGDDALARFIFLIKNDTSELLKIEVQRQDTTAPLAPSPVEFRVYRLVWNADFDFFRFSQTLNYRSDKYYYNVEDAIDGECGRLRLP